MSHIKATGTASEPTVSAEKDVLFLKQQTEIKTSEALIQEISAVVTEQQEEIRSSDHDTEQAQPKDTAQISETRRWSLSDGTIPLDEILKWMLEMEGKDWESFLEWWPDPNLDLSKQLQELSRLYLTLLEAALKYAEGENLAKQLERLDSLLAQKLNLLMDQNLRQLTFLLKETGQTTVLDSVRSSLYRQTAGRTISPQAAHTLFTHGGATGGRTSGFSPAFSFSGEGMIYQSSGKQNIRFQQTYHTQQNSWKEQVRQRNEIISSARKGIVENTFKQGNVISCTGRELEKANRFAAHINSDGNLFKNLGINARNEEVTGLLAAVMSIKAQVYAGENRHIGSITLPLENAIEKIIDHYLSQKGASKVYYYTLTAYKQTKNPEKAIQDGQDYACRQFREKQRQPAYEKSPQYSKASGFFRTLLKGLSPEKEFAMGVAILQKDWQNFLFAIGNRPNSSYLLKPEIFSPWGLLADTGTHRISWDKTIGKLLLGGAAIIIVSVLALLCFRFM